MAKAAGRRGTYVRDANGRFARTGGIGGGRQKVTVPRNFKVYKANPLAVSIAARSGRTKSRKATTRSSAPKQNPPKKRESFENFTKRVNKELQKAGRDLQANRRYKSIELL